MRSSRVSAFAWVAVACALGVASGGAVVTACASFTDEQRVEPGGEGGAPVDGGTAADADASAAGDTGADAPAPTGGCAAVPTTGLLFCADFQGGAITDGWGLTSPPKGGVLSLDTVDGRRAARVYGVGVGDGADDRVRADKIFSAPKGTETYRLDFLVRVATASSKAEVLALDTGAAQNVILVFVDGDRLRIRYGEGNPDSDAIQIPVGAWVQASLAINAANATLAVNGKSVFEPNASLTRLGGKPFQISAGLYYKEGSGDLDYALDDISLTRK